MKATLVRHAPWLLLLAAAAVLGTALASQYVGGLRPCVLCLYQRWPYVAVIALAVLAALAPRRSALRAGLLAASGIALLAGTAIAVFHVGVEQHWWAGLSSCGGAAGGSLTAAELREQLLTTPVVRCDEVAWSFLGVSMAGYNALVSLVLAAASLYAAARLRRDETA